MELVELLKSQLGVTAPQAEGGAGLLLNAAKENLGADQFAKLTSGIEGVPEMQAAAPQPEGLGGALGGLLSGFGGGGAQAGQLMQLAGGFSKLGLNQEMIGKFLPRHPRLFPGQRRRKGRADREGNGRVEVARRARQDCNLFGLHRKPVQLYPHTAHSF